jgi:DNA-binding NarL/FixJ family response regulator
VLSRSGRSAEAAEAACTLLDVTGADPEFVLRAAGIAAHALVQAGHGEDALELVTRWQPLAEQRGGHAPLTNISPLLRAQFRSARFLSLLYTGAVGAAETTVHDGYARSLEEDAPEASSLMAMGAGLVLLVRGDLRPAQRWLREAVLLLREADPSGSLPFALGLSAQALGQADQAFQAREAAAHAERAKRPGDWVFDADVVLGGAWAAAAQGALSEAQRLACAASDLAEERGALAPAFVAAHDVVRLGDPAAGAARLTRLARDVQGQLVVACAEHADAVVADHAERIEAAAARFAELGALLWAAEAESEAAAAHREAGREQSARAAAARAALLLEHCEGARTPALALAGPVVELTPREREVATLAAGGASNREIAERLVVSVRTVENNLQRAYGKLGIRNRRELAAALHVK